MVTIEAFHNYVKKINKYTITMYALIGITLCLDLNSFRKREEEKVTIRDSIIEMQMIRSDSIVNPKGIPNINKIENACDCFHSNELEQIVKGPLTEEQYKAITIDNSEVEYLLSKGKINIDIINKKGGKRSIIDKCKSDLKNIDDSAFLVSQKNNQNELPLHLPVIDILIPNRAAILILLTIYNIYLILLRHYLKNTSLIILAFTYAQRKSIKDEYESKMQLIRLSILISVWIKLLTLLALIVFILDLIIKPIFNIYVLIETIILIVSIIFTVMLFIGIKSNNLIKILKTNMK